MSKKNAIEKFNLDGAVCLITGGAGFLGQKHTEAILEAGGVPVILDINKSAIDKVVSGFKDEYKSEVEGYVVDITDKKSLEDVKKKIIDKYRSIDVLINNAANDPKADEQSGENWSRFENIKEAIWYNDLSVGLTGAFLCSQVFGSYMSQNNGGIILNISSDLGIIAPDQRIYRKDGVSEDQQLVKPVTYSVIKHALIGLTKYLATYWAKQNIRVNALCPGGIYRDHDEEFVQKLTNLIPMERMADQDEYKSAIIFLISDASKYMTGSIVTMDGGRTCW